MMRHLLRLVWNRKRTNALLIVEIFFSFLVVFAVGTLGVFSWDSYRRPLGYDWRNLWMAQIDMQQVSDDTFTQAQVDQFARLLKEVQSLDAVESAAGTMAVPYDFGSYVTVGDFNGKNLNIEFSEVTQDFDKVARLEIVRGRWFQPADAALSWRPVVIDEDLARDAFGDEDPIGKRMSEPAPGSETVESRVVGVVRDFRRSGELSGVGDFMFYLKRVGHPEDRPARTILVRTRPGTPAEFEEQLSQRLQAVAPDWSYQVKPLADLRSTALRLRIVPLLVGGLVGFFLLMMVGLGLLGVLWQNLLQRTREIGLRRAAGASRAEVHRQIILEQLLLTTLGVLLGTILVIQIPILDLIGIRPEIFAGGLLFAMAAIYFVATLCALYPSAMASRIQPAEALRYE
jgi:putative ABC transport system permease protein